MCLKHLSLPYTQAAQRHAMKSNLFSAVLTILINFGIYLKKIMLCYITLLLLHLNLTIITSMAIDIYQPVAHINRFHEKDDKKYEKNEETR
jgi:hypothetical protein